MVFLFHTSILLKQRFNMDTLYVITNPLFPTYIKIGYTKCLYTRLKKLSTGIPVEYTVLFKVKLVNAKKMEKDLHSYYGTDLLLNAKSCGSEWYPTGDREFFDTPHDFLIDIKKRIGKV